MLCQVYAFMEYSIVFMLSYAFLFGVVSSVGGLAVYARSLGKTIMWGAVGLVPYMGVIAGLLWLAPRGLGLAVLGLTLQACEWYAIGLARVPFSNTMLMSAGISVVGLAWYAYEQGRHPGLGLLGLIPVIGTAGGLMTVVARRSEGAFPDPSAMPFKARLAHGLLVPPAVVLGLYVSLVSAGSVKLNTVSPDGAYRLQLGVSPFSFDINYFLRLQHIGTPGVLWSERIYGSHDQGSKDWRVIWSKDSSNSSC